MYRLLVDDFYYETETFKELVNLLDEDYKLKDFDYIFLNNKEDFYYLINALKNKNLKVEFI